MIQAANSELRRLDARGVLANPTEERRTVVLRPPNAAAVKSGCAPR